MDMFCRPSKTAIPIHAVSKAGLKKWLSRQSATVKKWVTSSDFKADPGTHLTLAGKDGALAGVVLGVNANFDMWDYGGLAKTLPPGKYALTADLGAEESTRAAIAFGLGVYQFTRYKSESETIKVQLAWPKDCDQAAARQTVEAAALVRDLINHPAEDMGPSEMEAQFRALARKHKATVSVIKGNDLLKKNYPAIHAIGRACDDAPRLLDMRWGRRTDPKITLVGKGVCFDTGGLDIKTAAGMKTMKKDMGGAAHVLGVAHMLMAAKAPIRLRVMIPAVENNIDGNAIRPLDVIKTRSGKTIEIGNTDAEGRVILSDALYEASTEKPEFILDFATLTGAARVALGTELPALFCSDDAWAERVLNAGKIEQDQLWRMPLWAPYKKLIRGKTADITNAPDQPFGGAITAALFLQEFVGQSPWGHIDVMAWNQAPQPGRPEGGEAMGMRAVGRAIQDWAKSA